MRARLRAAFDARPFAWSAALVVAAALASSVTGLGNGFAYDDIPVIVENPMVTESHAPMEYLRDSYWGPSRGNSLYRPLTIQLFALQWSLGDGGPFAFHLANVLLYAATAVAVLVLLRLLLPAVAALVGALAWAVHPVHVEAVANVVGQSEMLAAIPMLLALALYIRERRRGPMRARVVAAILGCAALALLSKEHAILLPALLLLAEVVVVRPASGGASSGAVPSPAVPWLLHRSLALLIVAYLVVRTVVLEGLAGDSPHPAIETLSAGQRALAMLAIVPEYARLLIWPMDLFADYSPRSVPLAIRPGLAHLPGLAVLVAYGLGIVWAWRRDRVLTFALLWVPVTLALIANVLIPTGVILAERTLFLPSVAVAFAVGWSWPRLVAGVAGLPSRPVRVVAAAMPPLLLLAGVLRSAERQRVWEDNATLFSTLVVDAPDNYRAHHALGELFGGAGSWARAEHHLRIADSLFPGYDLLELSIARVLHLDDRCPEALPWYDTVLRGRPDAEVARVGRAACLLEVRRLSEARAEAVAGIARGLSVGPFGMLLQKAESSLAANDTVDARNRWWRAGAPVSKSDARLKVPVLIQRPAGSRGARRMRESSP
jgi:hypothetical protein